MPYFVYILLSLKDNRLYVGHTKNLDKRLFEHNRGNVNSTINRRPLTILHNEEYATRTLAMKREKFLKSLYSARFKQKLVKNYLIKKEILK